MPSSKVDINAGVRDRLRALLRPDQFEAWFHDLRLEREEEGKVTFSVPTVFIRDYIHTHHRQTLTDAVREVTQQDCEVIVDHNRKRDVARPPQQAGSVKTQIHDIMSGVEDAQSRSPEITSDAAPSPSTPPMVDKPSYEPTGSGNPSGSGHGFGGTRLNDDYTFEQYVVGPCNQLSHAAALAVGQNPGHAYNPLFVHGDVGLGKTHLLQSICHVTGRKTSPELKIAYLSCEDFTNRFIQSIQIGRLNEFREHYRSRDVLIVDDIQFLVDKQKTQDEFFHTFNALYNNKAQIVLSSDRRPEELASITTRLSSRFKWGLVTEIESPGLETRIAIVRRKAQMRGVQLSDDVIGLIAERVTSNVRELEGAVNNVLGLSAITGRTINLNLAEEVVMGLVPMRPNHISVPDIINLVTSEFAITVQDITGPGRTQVVSLPRHIAMFLAREHTDLSLEEIGTHFSNRDHTTVLYAVQKIRNRSKADRMFRDLIANLASRLRAGVS